MNNLDCPKCSKRLKYLYRHPISRINEFVYVCPDQKCDVKTIVISFTGDDDIDE